MTLINEEDAGWIGRATFASKYFVPLLGLFQRSVF